MRAAGTERPSAELDLEPLLARPWTGSWRRTVGTVPLWRDAGPRLASTVASAMAGVLVLGLLVLVLIVVMLLSAMGALGRPSGPTALQVQSIMAALAVASAIGVVLVLRRLVRRELAELLSPLRRRRLRAFAEANPGVDYAPSIVDPEFSGSLFQLGGHREAVDVIGVGGDRPMILGNYRFEGVRYQDRIGNGRAFAAIALPRAVPNLVLVARRGRFRSAIPLEPRRDQALHLEGDFDRRFTLYVPRGYERDALYIFAPDLMALVLDELGDVDIEFVDSAVFVYFRRPRDMLDPRFYREVARFAEVLGPKLHRQTFRYADERSAERRYVALPGRRIVLSTPIVTVLIGAALVAANAVRIALLFGQHSH